MITHLVFFRFKPEAHGQSASENAEMLKNKLLQLPNEISEIQSLSAGIDTSKSDASFELGLYTTFENSAALDAYKTHPAHQKVVQFITEVTCERAVVDYES